MKSVLIIIFLFFAATISAQEIKRIKVTDLEKTIKESKTPLIVNFWATFCVPCIEEIPYFQELAQQYKSKDVSLVFVSLDLREAYPSKIIAMAKRLNLIFPVAWLDETNADYFCPKIDTSWTGGMPSSLFVNNTTGYHKFYEDQVSREKLEKEIENMLKPKGN
jgi:thiol-disulfide isomerase/thioredoxin